MVQLSNNKFFRSILLTVAVTTFVTLCLFFARPEQVTASLDRIKSGYHASSHYFLSEAPPSSETSTPLTVNEKVESSETTTKFVPEPTQTVFKILPPKKGNPELLDKVPDYIKAIFDPADQNFQRFDCPLTPSMDNRYAYLQTPATLSSRPKYFFALDLHQNAGTLPQLMSSIFQVMYFLGPHNCVLSIVEGGSTDGTYEILRALAPFLEDMGIPYFLQISDLSPQRQNAERIVLLAELRNLALRDLYEHPDTYAPDTTIVFSNDIFICPEDILEIVHQQFFQGAHMTCGMDWANSSDPMKPRLYDTWIARSMTGDTFYKDMFDTDRGFFFDHAVSRTRWERYLPVQVFSCWNGIVALTARPFMDGTLRFRGREGFDREKKEEECFQGEPNLLTKDLWYLGYGRIATLPTIVSGYEFWEVHNAREVRGSVSDHLDSGYYRVGMERIEWQTEPPSKFRCIPAERPSEWVPWDQGLQAIYGDRRPAVAGG